MSLADLIPQGFLPELHNLNTSAQPPKQFKVKKSFWSASCFVPRGELVQVLASNDLGARVVDGRGDLHTVTWEYLCKEAV